MSLKWAKSGGYSWQEAYSIWPLPNSRNPAWLYGSGLLRFFTATEVKRQPRICTRSVQVCMVMSKTKYHLTEYTWNLCIDLYFITRRGQRVYHTNWEIIIPQTSTWQLQTFALRWFSCRNCHCDPNATKPNGNCDKEIEGKIFHSQACLSHTKNANFPADVLDKRPKITVPSDTNSSGQFHV